MTYGPLGAVPALRAKCALLASFHFHNSEKKYKRNLGREKDRVQQSPPGVSRWVRGLGPSMRAENRHTSVMGAAKEYGHM
jgi:hypothetical protein